MNIASVEALLIDRYLFVRVTTDDGLTGIGESGAWGYLEASAAAVEKFGRYLVGKDPLRIEHHWQYMYRFSHFRGAAIMGAISAIDIALWDIKGKVLGAPIYQLLGGPVRDRVPVYTHAQDASQGSGLDAVKQQARRAKDLGYQAIKTDPFKWAFERKGPFKGASLLEWLTPAMIGEAVEWIEAIRDAVGPDYELMVDAHARFDVPTAIRAARALESQNLMWLEEPVPPESYAALKQFRESTNVPVSVGETLFSRYDFAPIFEQRLADYVMPDVAWTGGISELRRIASMAETYYVPFTPHDAIGPVALMAAFHVCMATPNLYRQEVIHDWFEGFAKFIEPMFEYHDGALWPSNRPGLGVELVHEVVEEFALDPADPEASPFMNDEPRDE